MSLKNKLLNILSFGVYKKILEINNYNINYFNNLDFDKRFHYEKLKDPNKKSLLVIARFNQNGGIEKRQTIMLKYLEKYYNIFILSHMEAFNYNPLLSNKNYFVYLTNILGSPKNLLEQYIRKIIAYHNIDYTEVHFGSLLTLNYKNLKVNDSKLIGHMHTSLSFYKKQDKIKYLVENINNFDAIIKVKHNDINIIHPNIHVIQNGIEEAKNIYVPNKSNKCLIVSRLDKDKFIGIRSIIDFSSNNNIDVDIAGSYLNEQSLEDFKDEILNKFQNIKINFLGYIETTKFLKENHNKYLFVSGVGQVILEGISLGFPALQGSATNDKLLFIKKDNYLELYHRNFSKLEENSSTLVQDLNLIKQGKIEDFQLGNKREDMLISKLTLKYKEVLDNLN